MKIGKVDQKTLSYNEGVFLAVKYGKRKQLTKFKGQR